jgi:hypothetical protein
MQGASGDTGPMISYAADPAAADRNGQMLGYAAAAAVAGMLPPGTGMANHGRHCHSALSLTAIDGHSLGIYTLILLLLLSFLV